MEEKRRGGISLENRIDEKGRRLASKEERSPPKGEARSVPVERIAAAWAQPHAPALVTEPSGKTK